MDPELSMAANRTNGVEHDFGSKPTDINGDPSFPPLQQAPTSGSITLTPEMFERMYLQPQNKVSGDLRRTFGNPTPIGLGGFLIAYGPIIFSILGWRGYTEASATIGTYYFSGGMLAIIAMIMEWLLGNSFPATFFGVFGGFFLSYGATLTPEFYAYLAYDPSNAAAAVTSPEFLTGLGYWNLLMGIFTFYCTICASRVNLLFFSAFGFLAIAFFLIAVAYLYEGDSVPKTALAHSLQIAGGSFGMVTMVIGWYLLLAMMLATVDFPINLPVFDTSHIIPSGTEMRKRKLKKGDVEKQE